MENGEEFSDPAWHQALDDPRDCFFDTFSDLSHWFSPAGHGAGWSIVPAGPEDGTLLGSGDPGVLPQVFLQGFENLEDFPLQATFSVEDSLLGGNINHCGVLLRATPDGLQFSQLDLYFLQQLGVTAVVLWNVDQRQGFAAQFERITFLPGAPVDSRVYTLSVNVQNYSGSGLPQSLRGALYDGNYRLGEFQFPFYQFSRNAGTIGFTAAWQTLKIYDAYLLNYTFDVTPTPTATTTPSPTPTPISTQTPSCTTACLEAICAQWDHPFFTDLSQSASFSVTDTLTGLFAFDVNVAVSYGTLQCKQIIRVERTSGSSCEFRPATPLLFQANAGCADGFITYNPDFQNGGFLLVAYKGRVGTAFYGQPSATPMPTHPHISFSRDVYDGNFSIPSVLVFDPSQTAPEITVYLTNTRTGCTLSRQFFNSNPSIPAWVGMEADLIFFCAGRPCGSPWYGKRLMEVQDGDTIEAWYDSPSGLLSDTCVWHSLPPQPPFDIPAIFHSTSRGQSCPQMISPPYHQGEMWPNALAQWCFGESVPLVLIDGRSDITTRDRYLYSGERMTVSVQDPQAVCYIGNQYYPSACSGPNQVGWLGGPNQANLLPYEPYIFGGDFRPFGGTVVGTASNCVFLFGNPQSYPCWNKVPFTWHGVENFEVHVSRPQIFVGDSIQFSATFTPAEVSPYIRFKTEPYDLEIATIRKPPGVTTVNGVWDTYQLKPIPQTNLPPGNYKIRAELFSASTGNLICTAESESFYVECPSIIYSKINAVTNSTGNASVILEYQSPGGKVNAILHAGSQNQYITIGVGEITDAVVNLAVLPEGQTFLDLVFCITVRASIAKTRQVSSKETTFLLYMPIDTLIDNAGLRHRTSQVYYTFSFASIQSVQPYVCWESTAIATIKQYGGPLNWFSPVWEERQTVYSGLWPYASTQLARCTPGGLIEPGSACRIHTTNILVGSSSLPKTTFDATNLWINVGGNVVISGIPIPISGKYHAHELL